MFHSRYSSRVALLKKSMEAVILVKYSQTKMFMRLYFLSFIPRQKLSVLESTPESFFGIQIDIRFSFFSTGRIEYPGSGEEGVILLS